MRLAGVLAILVLASGRTAPAAGGAAATALTVIEQMVAMNAARAQALHAYTGMRSYHVTYSGLHHATADMRVRVEYQQPGPLHLVVVSASGSALLRHHVLEPLLKVEEGDSSQGRKQDISITPETYTFELVTAPGTDGQADWVIRATPRDRHTSWFRGTLWINPVDFGVERMQGQLTHSPSWWVTHTDVDYQTQHLGAFWLPAHHRAISRIRFLGHAELDILSEDFAVTSATPVLPPASSLATGGRGR